MTKKILYFTAGAVPSSGEIADINKLNALAVKPYQVTVMNGSVLPNLGSTTDIEGEPTPILKEADYVAGTVPAAYGDIDEIDPDEPPKPTVAATQVVIQSGDEITLSGKVYTFTVAAGAITVIAVEDEV